jgi:RNA polymerase sigma-70 factor (ECF subfamily)
MAAFEALYHSTAGRVFALCMRMTGDRERSRELAHDVFVRAWERLSSFRGESAFSTWLHRLGVNVVLESIRSERRRRSRVDIAGSEEEDERIAGASAAVMEDPAARIDLEWAIGLLPPNARRVFVMHDVEGYKHEEIARLMGTADGTVRAHLHRARKLLMEMLSR